MQRRVLRGGGEAGACDADSRLTSAMEAGSEAESVKGACLPVTRSHGACVTTYTHMHSTHKISLMPSVRQRPSKI